MTTLRVGFMYKLTVFSFKFFIFDIKMLPYERRNGIKKAPKIARAGGYSSFVSDSLNPSVISVTPTKVTPII